MPPKAATTSSASAGRQIQFLWRKSVITELIASANLALSLTGPATFQTGPAGGRLASLLPTAIEALRHQDQRVLLRIVTAQHRSYVAELLALVGSLLCRGFLRVS